VRHSRVELLESPVAFDADPKTDAGKRTVSIPPHVLPVLERSVRAAGIEARWVRPAGSHELAPGEVLMNMSVRTSSPVPTAWP
jgi:hypothetical protein